MDDGDPDGGSTTFRVNFTGEGLARLRETVNEKLKEFMGDYDDDTLAEYVIVLVKNGRQKEETRKELDVFLGDDSVAFVSWLWGHLSLNLHLYVHPKESLKDGGANVKSFFNDKSGRPDERSEHASDDIHSESENGRKRIVKISSGRRTREWRGLAQDDAKAPVFRSTTVENFPPEERTLRKRSPNKRSPSPRPHVQEKRRRQDERLMTKKDLNSKSMFGATSRLLQFAVRDAVRTVQQAATRSEPALKRLRSVVSASTADLAPDETYKRTRSAARVPGGIATAIRAAAEAANDATRVRSSRNVFSRLGHGADEVHVNKESSDLRVSMAEDENYEDFEQNPGSKNQNYFERTEGDGESVVDMMTANEETGMASGSGSGSGSDDDRYDNIGTSRRRAIDASQTQSAASALQDKDALMVQYSVAQNAEEVARKIRAKDPEPPVLATSNASHKIVNISVNVNTWKPPHYQSQRNNLEVNNQVSVEKTETGEQKLAANIPTGNNTTLPKNVDEKTHSVAQKDAQKSMISTTGSYSTARPSEDAHSRTIFVSNVHFAATKDTLSRHFNKFGEVLKVIIVTDVATGQPKGSAYVEFLRKESAELALSLNGTSFMSRILKVVRSCAHHETAAMMAWSRGAWTSSYPSRLGRIPFPRGPMGSAFRARLPIKPGARSLQWKREAPTNPTSDAVKNLQITQLSGNSIQSPTARSLTYVRSESKPDANSAPV
uniref:Polyadenylate-binding protein 2-A n=1 Tax=Anthurium amnicola TaxID=1678845 RepID=A0A1D1Z1Z7_9ARAE